jgi:hypothetical protein
MLRVRRRDLVPANGAKIGYFQLVDFSGRWPSKAQSFVTQSVMTGLREITIDENHGKPPYRTGGPFFSVKFKHPNTVVGVGRVVGRRITQSRTGLNLDNQPGDWRNTYTGSVVVSHGQSGFTSLGSSESVDHPDDSDPYVNPNDLSTLGPRAYARMRPKIEKANLAQTIVEMREAPQMLKQTAKGLKQSYAIVTGHLNAKYGNIRDLSPKRLRSMLKDAPPEVGSHYLNLQFGWKPFVKDIVNICDVIVSFNHYVDNARSINNKWVKRRWVEDDIQSNDLVYQNNGGSSSLGITPILSGSDFVSGGQLYQIRLQRLVQVWYEGSFRSYYPEFDDDRESGVPGLKKAIQAARLAGAIPDPVTVYKLIPFTWLGDWFVNVSDNLLAFQDLLTDAVASRYMYLMRRCYTRYEYRSVNNLHSGGVLDVKTYREVETKRRVPSASPFGFSLQPGNFTGSQWAILGALGLSKSF